jgi:hypothetical protein
MVPVDKFEDILDMVQAVYRQEAKVHDAQVLKLEAEVAAEKKHGRELAKKLREASEQVRRLRILRGGGE